VAHFEPARESQTLNPEVLMARPRLLSALIAIVTLGATAAARGQDPAPAGAPGAANRPLILLIDRSFLDNEMKLRDRVTHGALQVVASCAAVRPVGVVVYDKGLKVMAEPTANESIQQRAVEDAITHGKPAEGRSLFLSALREAGASDASGIEDSLRVVGSALQSAFGSGDILLLGIRMDLYRVPRPHPKYLAAAETLRKASIPAYTVDYSSNEPHVGFVDISKQTGGVADISNLPGDVPAKILQALCGR
jgi:hypothetical protein